MATYTQAERAPNVASIVVLWWPLAMIACAVLLYVVSAARGAVRRVAERASPPPRPAPATTVGAMPERLNRVLFDTVSGVVVIPSDARDALLEEVRGREGAESIVKAIVAVGASRPVELSQEEQALLLECLDGWTDPPEGIWDLQRALRGDVDATGQ